MSAHLVRHVHRLSHLVLHEDKHLHSHMKEGEGGTKKERVQEEDAEGGKEGGRWMETAELL